LQNIITDRSENDDVIGKMINDETKNLLLLMIKEKETREETEESILDIMKSMVSSLRSMLEKEKIQR